MRLNKSIIIVIALMIFASCTANPHRDAPRQRFPSAREVPVIQAPVSFDREWWNVRDYHLWRVNFNRALNQFFTEYIKSLPDVDNAHVSITWGQTELQPQSVFVIINPRLGSDITRNHNKIEGIENIFRFTFGDFIGNHIVITDQNGWVLNDFEREHFERAELDMFREIFTSAIINDTEHNTADALWAQNNNFVRITGGTFFMGSPAREPGSNRDEIRHLVRVSSFYMGKYAVTQREYQEIMGINPSHFKGDNLPVENVSWYDAIEFCNILSLRDGFTPVYTIDKSRSDPNNRGSNDDIRWVVTWDRSANGYRLPTEAEWEYACRAGTTTPFNTGINITTDQANFFGYPPSNNNIEGVYRETTTPVGSFAANPWGLYDMHGNVREWCWDWYGRYPRGETQTDPTGAAFGYDRVVRGGSWAHSVSRIRSASRQDTYPFYPSHKNRFTGFRLVRNADSN
jgi:formylglycine-generating enzyme required for sulfatase activity